MVLLLLVTAGGPAACGTGEPADDDGDTVIDSPCPQASEFAPLAASPVLAEKPAGTRLVETYTECTSDGSPYSGRFYETGMDPLAVASFYRETATRQGWTVLRQERAPDPARPAEGDDFLCARTPGPADPAYLELWWPDNDSGLLGGREEGTVYALDLSRSPRQPHSCSEPPASQSVVRSAWRRS
jgi:hypothetical protein